MNSTAAGPAFSEYLWSTIVDIYAAVLEHPFLTGLTDGTLPAEAFRHYVVQDAHYLRSYARALALCAAKAPDEHAVRLFAGDAAAAIAVEQGMHEEFLAEFGGSTDETPVLPTTLAYTSYILRVAHQGSFVEGLAGVLPCYWIYARVGAELLAKSSTNPLYARWIQTYGGEEFQQTVRAVLALSDRVGQDLAESEKARAVEHFVTTSRYEWMFWDAAWRRESWPV